MALGVSGLIQLGQDLFREALAKFHAPLVEGVDVPDRALGECQVLIVDNQCTESAWCDLLSQDRCCRSVAQEGLVLVQRLGCTLCSELIFAFSNHEGLGLGEEVTGQHLLVLVVIDWVMALGGNDEVSRDKFGALVQELVEGVLGISGRLAEEDGAGSVFNHVIVAGHGLAIGFHGQLLEVGREAVEILVEPKIVSYGNKDIDQESYGETRWVWAPNISE